MRQPMTDVALSPVHLGARAKVRFVSGYWRTRVGGMGHGVLQRGACEEPLEWNGHAFRRNGHPAREEQVCCGDAQADSDEDSGQQVSHFVLLHLNRGPVRSAPTRVMAHGAMTAVS